MKLLVDMSLPPTWAEFLRNAGWQAVHCSHLEHPPVLDSEVVSWARDNSHVLVTHDLDFGSALTLAGKAGPSIFQVVATDLMPHKIGLSVVRTLRELEDRLEQGAIMLIDLESGKAKVFRIAADSSTPES